MRRTSCNDDGFKLKLTDDRNNNGMQIEAKLEYVVKAPL